MNKTPWHCQGMFIYLFVYGWKLYRRGGSAYPSFNSTECCLSGVKSRYESILKAHKHLTHQPMKDQYADTQSYRAVYPHKNKVAKKPGPAKSQRSTCKSLLLGFVQNLCAKSERNDITICCINCLYYTLFFYVVK